MRYIIFILVVIVALTLTSDVFSSKRSEITSGQASVYAGVGSILDSLGNKEEASNLMADLRFHKAFDIREGDNFDFEGLAVRFTGLEKTESCTELDCRKVALEFSGEGAPTDATLSEGEVIESDSFRIKLSQVAPADNRGQVPYRSVLLIEKKVK